MEKTSAALGGCPAGRTGTIRYPDKAKILAIHSSFVLATNTFGRFASGWGKPSAALLRVLVAGPEATVRLECECPFGEAPPIGMAGGTPPQLDVGIVDHDRVVMVESKCVECFKGKAAKFDSVVDAYEHLTKHHERDVPAWRKMYLALVADPGRFKNFDAAQLLKHLYGIRNTYATARERTLLYLYWEPQDAESQEICQRHRQEFETFRQEVEDQAVSHVRLRGMSYPELWTAREAADPTADDLAHIAALGERYCLALA